MLMKNIAIVRATALILLTGLALSACGTMRGAGEDTTAAGNAVQRAAQ